MTDVDTLLRSSRLPVLEARALLAHVLGGSREQLVAWPEREIEAAQAHEFATLAGRRAAGEPLAYLLGRREFYGREFLVTPAVLVPRPETELLVEVALTCIAPVTQPQVLELGTGSGCIAVTLALQRPDARVHAVDRCPAALAVARSNAARLQATVSFALGDWLDGAGSGYDLIVSNPPYVAAGDPHLPALRHEPETALVAGVDGLDDLTRIIGAAAAHLNHGGWLAVEHGHDQAARVRTLCAAHGIARVESRRDLQGIERVTVGQRL